ncbi:ATP-binding protein [Enterococcus faecalis]|uniref:ATP-binding protein n=1 Tax=Enterococcus faecalis TaxID=1351 RepID=UPI003D152510
MSTLLTSIQLLFPFFPEIIFDLTSEWISKYDLVILDELGYVSFDQVGSEILFHLLSNRTSMGSIIITTNLSFDRWEEIFKDPMLTAAMGDRIAHRTHVLDLSGKSFRVEDTKKMVKLTGTVFNHHVVHFSVALNT